MIVVSTLFFSTSCKKSSSGSNGVSATVNGSGFNPAQTQAVDLQGGLTIAGFTITGTDSLGITESFNDTISVNKAQDIFASNNVLVTYKNKSLQYNSWAGHSHGTLTVTTLDKTGKHVAGSFSGVIYSAFNGNSSDSVVITNGNFNAAFLSY